MLIKIILVVINVNIMIYLNKLLILINDMYYVFLVVTCKGSHFFVLIQLIFSILVYYVCYERWLFK